MRTYKTSNIQYIAGFKNSLNSFHFYLQQDLKCQNKKAVEVVPLVKGLKEKDKRIGKTRKMGGEGEKKIYVDNIQKERLITEMRTNKFCG